MPFEQIGERIHEDGGRYVAIVDYALELAPRFQELFLWLREKQDVMPEGRSRPKDDRPGRSYLAVRKDVEPADLFNTLREHFGDGLTWVHLAKDEDEG